MKLKVNNKEYDVEVVTSDEDQEKGLQGVEFLDSNKGMLFQFEEVDDVSFWMKDTLIDLDIVFIDEDNEVISVSHGKANDETPIEEEDVKCVLEVNSGSKIKPGMEVSFETELHVLDSEGKTQMLLKGGEIVFSRKNTKTIVKLAKEAEEEKSDKLYKKLGRKMFQYLDIQQSNDEEYVELK